MIDAATRLWRLIEKLLDLSVLQAGRASPRLVWYSIDEVLQEAIEQVSAETDVFKLSVQADMPLLRGDPAQLERAFANVLENAARYSGEKPVSVRARRFATGFACWSSTKVRASQQASGSGSSFLSIARRMTAERHPGSGLGLAITRGFFGAQRWADQR